MHELYFICCIVCSVSYLFVSGFIGICLPFDHENVDKFNHTVGKQQNQDAHSAHTDVVVHYLIIFFLLNRVKQIKNTGEQVKDPFIRARKDLGQ